jgi:hypothetical protein
VSAWIVVVLAKELDLQIAAPDDEPVVVVM